ncbi:FtsK/SpoIIIE domain-containing protein [Oerskovia sp. M15]
MIGVGDVPERQMQTPVYFEPDVDGHVAIYGTGGSGKSTTLRTLGIAAASRRAAVPCTCTRSTSPPAGCGCSRLFRTSEGRRGGRRRAGRPYPPDGA